MRTATSGRVPTTARPDGSSSTAPGMSTKSSGPIQSESWRARRGNSVGSWSGARTPPATARPPCSGEAVEHLNQAVLLDPHSVAARYARAMLNCQQGKPAAAENDLQFILKRNPNNYRALDALGEVDLTLNRPAQAEEYLRKAANLAPTESNVLIHFARALQEVGREEAAQKVLSSLKQPVASATRPGPRTTDFQRMLSMPTAQ